MRSLLLLLFIFLMAARAFPHSKSHLTSPRYTSSRRFPWLLGSNPNPSLRCPSPVSSASYLAHILPSCLLHFSQSAFVSAPGTHKPHSHLRTFALVPLPGTLSFPPDLLASSFCTSQLKCPPISVRSLSFLLLPS